MKLSIVIVNRNRSFDIVIKTLNSIVAQLNEQVELTLVDYGSDLTYQQSLKELINNEYHQIHLILCPTQGQLFHKTRAINMVLRECISTHFMVLDMDCMMHPSFIESQLSTFTLDQARYYSVGFLSKQESLKNTKFENYKANFISDQNATGISVFPTQLLKEIRGFDEFYHSWGSEDTDVHERLKNHNCSVLFYDKEVLFKHQWHKKKYRSKSSLQPFHAYLERVNHSYFKIQPKTTVSNGNFDWGKRADSKEYAKLEYPSITFSLTAIKDTIQALVYYMRHAETSEVIHISIKQDVRSNSFKNFIKKIIGKKTDRFISLENVNEILLEYIILNCRNHPYEYTFNRDQGVINFKINLLAYS